jgi:hypothetical protein
MKRVFDGETAVMMEEKPRVRPYIEPLEKLPPADDFKRWMEERRRDAGRRT